MTTSRGAGVGWAALVYLLGLAAASGAVVSELKGVQATLARIEAFEGDTRHRVEALEVWRAAHEVAYQRGQ